MTTNRELALVMGRLTAEEAIKSLQNSHCIPQLESPHEISLSKNESAPDSLSDGTHTLEQPSPEVCSQPAYVLACLQGMARTG
jgi:hypothetical protein